MNVQGVLIGLIAFLIIGVFHPIVIKGEYYFGKGIWPIFLVAGIIFLVVSLFTTNQILSAILGVIGFSCLWSIIELFEQEERVKKAGLIFETKYKNFIYYEINVSVFEEVMLWFAQFRGDKNEKEN